tara:strand:+ start:274 stop:492 length:219 start_codon:yes stop_codon:yes gene_type:complete
LESLILKEFYFREAPGLPVDFLSRTIENDKSWSYMDAQFLGDLFPHRIPDINSENSGFPVQISFKPVNGGLA